MLTFKNNDRNLGMTLAERAAQEKYINDILSEAKTFGRHHCATYSDHERYKQLLQNRGIYGYEDQIAEALQL